MHKILLFLSLTALLVAAAPTFTPPTDTPGDVIAIINQYRAENGLPAYLVNDTLMSIAQGQADYLASLGTSSDVHAGPGGSRPRDRAFAAGYGGGAQFFLSEIGKYGMGETAQSAVNWWKQSPDHNPTMIASTYVEIGCGVATDGNSRYYYICDTGYIVGGSYVPSGSSSSGQQQAAPVMIPVVKANPQPDGSILHIIRTGQTLWTLAAVYEVPLQQILELNNFSESQIIHPGDEVMVAPAGSAPTVEATQDPEATAEASGTATEEQSPGLTPSPSPTSEELAAAAVEGEATSVPLAQVDISPEVEEKAANSTVFLIVGVALVSIIGVFAASFFIQRPRAPEPEGNDNDPFAPIN